MVLFRTLKKHGTDDDNIVVRHVPGSFELTLGAQFLAEYDDLDAVICLGCVIQGETPHFTYICQGVTQGITSLIWSTISLLFLECLQQAIISRQLTEPEVNIGNKGDEAAVTAIKMAALQREMEK